MGVCRYSEVAPFAERRTLLEDNNGVGVNERRIHALARCVYTATDAVKLMPEDSTNAARR